MPDEAALPSVSSITGFMVRCSEEVCGELAFYVDRAKADEEAATHLAAHVAHRKRLDALLASGETTDVPNTPKMALHCPGSGCGATIGETHKLSCDLARCLVNGGQRALKAHVSPLEIKHHCGADVWTGYYPGEQEASEYGVTKLVLLKLGIWDKDRHRWILPDGYEQQMLEQGLAPMPSQN